MTIDATDKSPLVQGYCGQCDKPTNSLPCPWCESVCEPAYLQLVRLIEEAYVAGYSAHIQDIAWGRDERYERVDL